MANRSNGRMVEMRRFLLGGRKIAIDFMIFLLERERERGGLNFKVGAENFVRCIYGVTWMSVRL